MPDVLCINGRFTTTDEKVIGVEDRGFQFGDAIYEVLKFRQHRPIFVTAHFERMALNLAELEIDSPWSVQDFGHICAEMLERTTFESGLIYIQISRGESERAHFYPENLTPTVVAYTRSFEFPDELKKERGVRLSSMDDQRWKLSHIKSVNLLANARAKKAAQRAGADEALLLRGTDVIEGASSSFFAVSGQTLITHPADLSLLPGTVRDKVLALARSAAIMVVERPLSDHELDSIDEAFITSTTQGVMPVSHIDGRMVGSGRRGELTTRLQKLYDALELAEIT